MGAWIEMMMVVGLVAVGIVVGRRWGRSRSWWVGFGVAIMVVALLIVGRRWLWLSFVPPISWMVRPWVGPMMMGLAIAVMLEVLAVRIGERRKRVMVRVLMGVMAGYFAVLPVAGPLWVRGNLRRGSTEVNGEGVCLQTHFYSCGPAAAVTCLWALGVRGEEGVIGAAAWTAPAVGTDGWMLAAAVKHLYGAKGVRCMYRYVGKLEELRVPAVAAIWSPEYGGHYLAVLAVEKEAVVVGDPLSGKYRMGRGEFLWEWGGAAVEFRREQN